MAVKKIKLQEEAVSAILVADTQDQVLRLVMLKTSLRKKKRNNNRSSKPQQKRNYRLQQVADYQPGNPLRKEHEYSVLVLVQQK